MFGAETAPPDPPGAVATRAPGLKIATQERREGGPGGRNAGTRAPEESEHAPAPRHRSRPPYARYNRREGGRRFTAQSLKQPTRNGDRNAPAPPASGNHFRSRQAKKHLFFFASEQALLRGYRPKVVAGGGA